MVGRGKRGGKTRCKTWVFWFQTPWLYSADHIVKRHLASLNIAPNLGDEDGQARVEINWTPHSYAQAGRWWCIQSWEYALSLSRLISSIKPTRRPCWPIRTHNERIAPLADPHHTLNTVLSLCLKLLHILRAWVLLFLDSQILTQCLSHCRHATPVCWMKSMAWSLVFKSANQGQAGHGKTLGKSFALSKPQFLICKMGIIRKQHPERLWYVKCLKDACLNRWQLCVVASLWDGPQGLWPPGIHSLG